RRDGRRQVQRRPDRPLQMAGLGGRLRPAVVQAVEVGDRRIQQLGRAEVVEAGQVDRDEGAADLLDVAAAERADAAVTAEQVPGPAIGSAGPGSCSQARLIETKAPPFSSTSPRLNGRMPQ